MQVKAAGESEEGVKGHGVEGSGTEGKLGVWKIYKDEKYLIDVCLFLIWKLNVTKPVCDDWYTHD